ncbi:hypothetical protein E1301_Tti021994 [Triplophysa tibetana]|uniref:Uncharacterized protein n=1 Tax=Triplophysa tibetana TaxID=1572043 RepID=A0A5A9P1T5_9TELE|nr:hypothetical protein E1301_Tti021994 [Triplophysa tibetana]
MAKKGEKAAFLNQHTTQYDWMTFTLVKRKMTAVSIHECDDYDLKSHVVEENEEVDGRTKPNAITESEDLEDK